MGGAERYGIIVEPVVQAVPFLWSNGADVLSRDLRA